MEAKYTKYMYGVDSTVQISKIENTGIFLPFIHIDKSYVFVNIIKNIFLNSEFKDLNGDTNGINLNRIAMMASVRIYNNNQRSNDSSSLSEVTLSIPLTELNLEAEEEAKDKFSCLSYANSDGLYPYIDSFIKMNKNEEKEISYNVWKKQSCKNSANITHFI